MENLKTATEGLQMQVLLEEVKTILKDSSDLNQHKKQLGRLVDEIMYWTKEGNQQYEDYYKHFCEMVTAMTSLDFSKRLPEGGPKTLFNFVSLGLNILNEELIGKVLSVRMLHALLDVLDLKNTVVIITNPNGQITFLHTEIKNVFYSEKSLLGQHMNILIEDFTQLDNRLKSDGVLKGVDVKIKCGGSTTKRIVTLRLAMPTLLKTSEGIAYIITFPGFLI